MTEGECPVWVLSLLFRPTVDCFRRLRERGPFNVNAVFSPWKLNILWNSANLAHNCELLQELLNAGLNAAHVDANGSSYLYYRIDQGFFEADLPGSKLLIDYGCSFPAVLPHYSPSESHAVMELQAYAIRSTARKEAARGAVIAFLAASRPRLGRDVGALVGRVIWISRRNRFVWQPSEKLE